MTKNEYNKMLAKSGGITDSDNKKSVENPPQLDKKDEETLDRVWQNNAKSSKHSQKPLAA